MSPHIYRDRKDFSFSGRHASFLSDEHGTKKKIKKYYFFSRPRRQKIPTPKKPMRSKNDSKSDSKSKRENDSKNAAHSIGETIDI